MSIFRRNSSIRFPKCKGKVIISETKRSDTLLFTVSLQGLKPRKHGFTFMKQEIYQKDVEVVVVIQSLGKNHGGLDDGLNRHLGDLGNIEADKMEIVRLIYAKHPIKRK